MLCHRIKSFNMLRLNQLSLMSIIIRTDIFACFCKNRNAFVEGFLSLTQKNNNNNSEEEEKDLPMCGFCTSCKILPLHLLPHHLILQLFAYRSPL